MRTIQLAAFVLLSAAGCVTDAGDEGRPSDEDSDWRSGGKGDGETCDFDQMSAETYYKQFAYEEIVSPSGGKWYRIGGTWDVTGVLASGDTVKLAAYFLPNGRVIAEYHEQKRIDSSRSEVINKTVIVTRAKIDATTRGITLEGIGAGTPLTVTSDRGCAPGIVFKFSGDLRSPGLAGDDAVIQTLSTSAYVIDPDNLDAVPSAAARQYFQEDVASGKIKVVRI